jgi:hypothetical protein
MRMPVSLPLEFFCAVTTITCPPYDFTYGSSHISQDPSVHIVGYQPFDVEATNFQCHIILANAKFRKRENFPETWRFGVSDLIKTSTAKLNFPK